MNTVKPNETPQTISDVDAPDGVLIGHLQYDAVIQTLVEENNRLQEHLSQLHAQMSGMDTATEFYGSLVRRPNLPDELFFKDENGHIHSVVLHFLDKDEVQPC